MDCGDTVHCMPSKTTFGTIQCDLYLCRMHLILGMRDFLRDMLLDHIPQGINNFIMKNTQIALNIIYSSIAFLIT